MEKFLLNIDDKELDDLKFKISQGRIIDWGSYHKDDAGISFRDDKYCIHHGNDNWFKLQQDNLDKLKHFSKSRK